MAEFGAEFACTNPFAKTSRIALTTSLEATTKDQTPYSTPAFIRHRRNQEGLLPETLEDKIPA